MSKISDYAKALEEAVKMKPAGLEMWRGSRRFSVDATNDGNIRFSIDGNLFDFPVSDAKEIISWLKENCE